MLYSIFHDSLWQDTNNVKLNRKVRKGGWWFDPRSKVEGRGNSSDVSSYLPHSDQSFAETYFKFVFKDWRSPVLAINWCPSVVACWRQKKTIWDKKGEKIFPPLVRPIIKWIRTQDLMKKMFVSQNLFEQEYFYPAYNSGSLESQEKLF